VGSTGSSGPTVQQQQLETEQALTNANLNLEENSQRKSILNAMLGTRVFRGSALSRAMRGNNNIGANPAPGPSQAQVNAGVITPVAASLLDTTRNSTTGAATATTAGGAGAGGGFGIVGGRGGGAGAGAQR
jgi:hypothetical protein